jgi:hypothetical protein
MFADIAPDSGGGIRTVADVWPILLAGAIILCILATALWRLISLAKAFARGDLSGRWQAIEFFSLGSALFVFGAVVTWGIWELWFRW